MMAIAVGDHRCFALESQHVPCSKFEFVLSSHDTLRFQNQVGLSPDLAEHFPVVIQKRTDSSNTTEIKVPRQLATFQKQFLDA